MFARHGEKLRSLLRDGVVRRHRTTRIRHRTTEITAFPLEDLVGSNAAVRPDHDVPVEQHEHRLRLLSLPDNDFARRVRLQLPVRDEPRMFVHRCVGERAVFRESRQQILQVGGLGLHQTVRK